MTRIILQSLYLLRQSFIYSFFFFSFFLLKKRERDENNRKLVEIFFLFLSLSRSLSLYTSTNKSFFTIGPSRDPRNCRLSLWLLSEIRLRGAGHEERILKFNQTSPPPDESVRFSVAIQPFLPESRKLLFESLV